MNACQEEPKRVQVNSYTVQFRDLLNLLKPSPLVPTDERRETIRLRCDLSVLLKVEESFRFAKVMDVTLTGLCLHSEDLLKPGQVISLSRDDFGPPLEAEVLWCKRRRSGKGFRIGVGYQADHDRLRVSWLRPALKQAGFKAALPGQMRKLLRVPGRVTCQIKGLTGEAYTDGEMLDLSVGGALVESPVEFPKDLSIEFETVPLGGLPPLKGFAKIVSCHAGEQGKWKCGLRFTESKAEDIKKYMNSMLGSR